MKYWQREHAALLNALRAASIVPTLYRRLSLERYTPTDVEIRRLRDWAASLRDDPAWSVVAAVLDKPAAWPLVWEEASHAGFSARSDHHHALLLGRFCERFLAAQDFEGAAWSYRQSVAAWSRVFATDYPRELADVVAPDLPDPVELLETMLDDVVDARVRNMRAGTGLATPAELPALDRRMLRFAHRALRDVQEIVEAQPSDPHGTLARLARLAREGIGTVNAEILSRFDKIGDDTDLAVAEGDGILGRFRWVAEYFEIVGHTEQAATDVVGQAVETCWALRRIGRDGRPEFAALLPIVAPFNDELLRRVMSLQSAFGHNGVCADFLVFQGEKAKGSDERKAIFQKGLDVCPGHRNSAMLLAWELVHEANGILTQTALAPSLLSIVPGTASRVDQLVKRAWDLCNEAERIYAFNENLPETRDKVRAEAARLRITLPEAGEEP